MDNPDIDKMVDGNNEFAFDLYSQLKVQDKNLFFSPFSISMGLVMAYAGARGNTATQMEKALHFPYQENRLHPLFKTILQAVSSEERCKVTLANALWIRKEIKIASTYLDIIKDNYGDAIFEVDMAAPETVHQINEWVAENTNGKINNIISSLGPATRFVLANAIYFKGLWKTQFEKQQTKNEPFTLKSGEKVDVPMMRIEDESFHYLESPNFQMMGMFYRGNQMAMVILLPRSVDDLEIVENSLTNQNMDSLFQKLQRRQLDVYIPRFKFTDEFKLEEILPEMGMIEAFKPQANFSGMAESEDILIDAIIHKAFVDVNEEGTEAAAATTIITDVTGMPRPPNVFRADHPFFFFIRDLRSRSILFIGRVLNPKSTG